MCITLIPIHVYIKGHQTILLYEVPTIMDFEVNRKVAWSSPQMLVFIREKMANFAKQVVARWKNGQFCQASSC
jgi:hypothetical protein